MNFLNTLLPIFLQTVLPVFLVAGAGFLLATFITLDGRSIGRLLFYLATPALVFRSLYQTQLDYTVLGHLTLVAVSAAVLAGLLGWLVGAGQERKLRAAIVLTSAVSNNGDTGMALATVYYVISSFLSNTFGSVVASAGERSLAGALKESLRVPVLYAATAGLLCNALHWELPQTLFRSVDLLANAAIPGMLVLLGVQLRGAPLWQSPSVIFRSVAVRLFAAPGVAWLLCLLWGITGVERGVLILQAAMPTAVMTAVIATEFDTAPQFVAAVIFFSTALSMVTLSIVLWWVL
jgi:malate permease and related proteins